MIQPTSAQTYYDIVQSGELGESQREVLRLLIDRGPLTGSEVNTSLHSASGHKRLSELEKMGVVRAGIPRICTVTQREAIEWEVTGRPPVRPVAGANAGTPSRKVFKAAVEELLSLVRFRKLHDPGYAIPEELLSVGKWLRKKTS